jgi:hypothetical protein
VTAHCAEQEAGLVSSQACLMCCPEIVGGTDRKDDQAIQSSMLSRLMAAQSAWKNQVRILSAGGRARVRSIWGRAEDEEEQEGRGSAEEGEEQG